MLRGVDRRIRRAADLLALLALTATTGSMAQQPTALGNAGNDVQRPIGQAMQIVYTNFVVATGGDPDLLEDRPGQQDLFLRCSELVETAEFLSQSGWVPQGERIQEIMSLEQLGAALQQVGSEEFSAEGTNSAEISRLRVLMKRLAALRRAELAGPDHGNILESGPWGLFFDGALSFGRKDATLREDAFDYNVPALTMGVDYRFGSNAVFGGALGYETFDADFKNNLSTVAGGDLESDLLSLSAYSSYRKQRLYLDWTVSFGWNDYKLTRRIVYPTMIRTAEAVTNGREHDITAALGYLGRRSDFHYVPFVRFRSLGLAIDGYTETGARGLNLQVRDQEIDSLMLILGSQFSWAIGSGGGVFVPRFLAEWYHEFQNASRSITAGFANDPFGVFFSVPTDEPDEDFFNISAGISYESGAARTFLRGGAALDLNDVTIYTVTGGVRFAL